MIGPFTVPPGDGFDLVALGALVVRLDPGEVPFGRARSADIHVSGAEYNVAANLADCFGLRTAVASAMVDYPIGELVAERVRAAGVTGLYRHFEHDGASGPNIATVYSDRGSGVRPPIVFYNRANEAAGQLRPGDFDWPAVFGKGVRWFHTGGLFASLSAAAPDLIVEAMQAARAAGAVVSFDVNFREPLWRARGGEAHAQATIRRIAEHVDVLVGSDEGLRRGLGLARPDVGRRAAAARPPSRPRSWTSSSGSCNGTRRSASWRRRCATSTRRTATALGPSPGSTDRRTSSRLGRSTSWTASGAATASQPASSTG